MAGTKTEYPALLASLQPSQAASILNARVRQIHKINEDVSEWLAERRKVEEEYAAGLQRLCGRRAEFGTDLGVFRLPWESIIAGTVSLAEAHYGFARRLQSDGEAPLRDQRRDLTSINSLQSNLASMAKELEKIKKRTGASADSAASQWESQAPYVFEQLQGLDETRVNQMREILTQLQTHAIDCHERSKTSAETGLNALLNVDASEEVSAFVARTSSDPPPVSTAAAETGARPMSSSRHRTTTSHSERGMAGSGTLVPPSSRRRDTDDQRSEVSEQDDDVPKLEKKSRLSGLRRLGTVMSRRKEKEKVDDKPERPRRNPLRRGSSSAQQQMPSANNSTPEIPALLDRTRRTSANNERPTLTTDVPSAQNGLSNSAVVETPTEISREAVPTTNGQPGSSTSVPQIGVRPPSTIAEEGFTTSALADIERAQQEANSQENDNAFSLNIRDKPIHEESSDQQAAAMANVSSALRASVVPPPARRSGTLRGRRDVRNTMFVPNPTPDMFTSPPPEVPSASPLPVSPIPGIATSPIAPSDARSADAQSIRSAHSVANSLTSGASKHAEMVAPGLNASIVETSSATFNGDVVTKAVVIGELALVHNGSISGSANPHIRLDNFQVLEKVAPNPAFISQIPAKSGEYNVDLSQISKTSVAFKYQIHLDGAQTGNYAPLLLTTQHKIDGNQFSVIINYSLNPAFAAPTGASSPISLQNAVILLTVEGAKASSCQSKPPGVFSSQKSLIYWKLGDLVLASGALGGKLLARFATEGEATGSSTEARWEIKGAGSGLGVSVLAADGASSSTTGGAGTGTGGLSSDPFTDAGASSVSLVATKELEVARKLIGGRYIAS